ncbi:MULTISPECIES: hypothetical protein [Rhizobium]|uniref:Uncharacterized protein n=2 Tax=Rhizobium TaxID=379 RepID=A0A1C3XBX5_9HYPH|nr:MULTISPECIES: hypothetical protein [Rhizobium]MBB4244860.1 hypothetical protein [Rhizobium tropici]MBB5596247.1 hypothetical protein [Rhizobium tropici]MBB6305788.1 hypothetical protein [Rhizobium leucaenae]MBB6488225.1 hypothetical protein [Rhizobium lusitanum]MBB6495176.1 hypothetical protein [Rhizobium tropici]
MRKQFRMQLDLFVTARPVDLSDTQRREALTLLQLLLTEAAAKLAGKRFADGGKEAGNE